MAQYIKMSNGPIKVLVDIKDTATLQDKMEDGFYAELDNDGNVVLVDSSTLVSSESDAVNEVLNMVKAKQAQLTKTKSLKSRSGK